MRIRGQRSEVKGRSRLGPLAGVLRMLLLSFALARPALAGEIFSGRLFTVPEKIYVNQTFEIHFELEVSFGSEVEDLRISDFPNNPDLIAVGRLESTARNRVTRDAQTLDVLQFTAEARCFKPINHTFNPAVQCMLVERRNTGFFSHLQSYPKQKQLAPFALRILPLPQAGRPAHFSGAIGSFRLSGRISQATVQPGDIITLGLELSGQGWLGDAVAMPAPPASPLFKTYPVKELLREPVRLKTEQMLIPQSTNATEIAATRFCFFNPATDRYEESVAGPFRLTFKAADATPKADDVRVIDTVQPSPAAETLPQTVTIERVNLTLRHVVPLLVGSCGALAAFFVFFLLYGAHKRLAFAAGCVLLAAGIGAGYALSGKADVTTRTLAHRAEVRFAPSRGAATLFALNPGTSVIPLEDAGAWIRIDAAGRRGWIMADAIAPAASTR